MSFFAQSGAILIHNDLFAKFACTAKIFDGEYLSGCQA